MAFVNYDVLCKAPVSGLDSICDLLDVTDLDISAEADRFRPSNSYQHFAEAIPHELMARASAAYSEVERVAVN